MNRDTRTRATVAASLAGLWLVAAAGVPGAALGAGYLVREGPSPLRFAARPKPSEARVPLPALALVTPESAAPPERTPPLDPSADDAVLSGSSAGSRTGEGLAAPVERILPPPAATIPPSLFPGMSVSPQVLLSYFGSPGTNVVGPAVMVPLSFVPPQPGVPAPSSRATYKTVP